MNKILKLIVVVFICIQSIQAIELMKLGVYKDQNITGWYASEKLDGIRAYWDGKNLLSRQGKVIKAPKYFLKTLPDFALDGELYTKRNEFEKIQNIVMDQIPNEKEWKNITYYIFDAPNANGGLIERLKVVQDYIDKNSNNNDIKNHIKLIPQKLITSKKELDSFLDEIVSSEGEGVVIRDPNSIYIKSRSNLNLKYKRFIDSECKVISINKGSGKYKDLMGSITCELSNKIRFKIGSGFSDYIRKNPPKIGSIITFKYQNLTKNGIPRFATFLRVRKD
ncbi:DNA ligase [Campylobacter pinnipediorum subsp. caledonicus]|uniref:DNA ligase n=1 Tax=Campylobacter pinnipediorum TaxID=1965231 RepID=UPI0009C1B31C|nr:DNA ligase [Campylobacter pinnipediorum]AQW85739.1 DNA ligase [Campylobacter pinnipediorum subsp. caledonicus]